MLFLQILAGLIALILVYLIVVIFSPWVRSELQPVTLNPQVTPPPEEREDFDCEVAGTTVRGWIYRTDSDGPSPCVIMSHGFCGTKDGLIETYAKHFRDQGIHALSYDFRHFGDSDGEPRQLYCGKYQLEDLTQIVSYTKSRPDVDENAIFLWGTSAGAHLGILAAADDPAIAGVIGQCGAYDRKADADFLVEQVGKGHFLKLFVHAQRDKGRSRFGLSPHMITAYGREGTLAMFSRAGLQEHIQDVLGGSQTFVNAICARSLIMPHGGDTIQKAETVQCPVLIQRCRDDELVSPDSHTALVKTLGDRATVIEYPIGHFDIYLGEHFKRAVEDQLAFVKGILETE